MATEPVDRSSGGPHMVRIDIARARVRPAQRGRPPHLHTSSVRRANNDRRKSLRWLARAGVTLLLLSATPASTSITDRIYNPPKASLTVSRLDPSARLITARTQDGLSLNGILVPPKGKPMLLVLHGSGTSADNVGEWLRPLSDSGYGLVLVEYRGFAGNPGQPSQAGLALDARAFLEQARLLYPKQPVIAVGHSLGGAVAFQLALAEKIDALVTIGAFTSLHDVAPKIARPFLKDRYDNLAALRKLDMSVPYFLLHGTADELIPTGAANQIHNLAVELKRPGGTFVLAGQRHRPDAALLGAVLDYVLTSSPGGERRPPAGVTIAPFR